MAQQWGGKLQQLIRLHKLVSDIILCTLMILQFLQRGTRGKFCRSLAHYFWVFLQKAALVRHPQHLDSLSLPHTHSHSPASLTKCFGPCYDLKVLGRRYIFHKGILLHPHGWWGTVHCGLVPRQLRIKCRTWHWNRNLTAVSSGNLDLDLNSNKVLFFFSQHKPDPSKNTPLCISAVTLY